MSIYEAITKLEKMADSTLLRLEGDYNQSLECVRFEVLKRYLKRIPVKHTFPRTAVITTPLITEPLDVMPILYKITRIGNELYPTAVLR